MSVLGSLDAVERDGRISLAVHVQPRASREGLVGLHGKALKVAVRAPADKGRANAALCELLASTLGLAKSAVGLETGATSRSKRVFVEGIRLEDMLRKLEGSIHKSD